MEILIAIAFITFSAYITWLFIYWLFVFLIATINYHAKYDESSKMAILSLAKKDRIWKDVAKILDLEREGE